MPRETPRRICVAVTARPSYSRIRSAMAAIASHPDLELLTVAAASAVLDRFGNVANLMEADGFKVAHRAHTILEGGNRIAQAKSTGLGLIEMTSILSDLQPDAVVTIADRFETMATAVAAAYLNIPLVHIQGGEITGNIDNKVRDSITKLADLHLAATERAGARLVQMGERPEAVHVTGCPSIDIAARVQDHRGQGLERALSTLFERHTGVGAELDLSDGYLVVLQHPVTTEDDQARMQVEETLHAVHKLKLPTLWFWPNVDAGSDVTSQGIRRFREQHEALNIHFFKNLPPEEFLCLLTGAIAIVGNSSVGLRECAYLGVPAINIGIRQRNRERGANVVDTIHDRRAIADAILRVRARPRPRPDPLYGQGDAGARIAGILASAPLTFDK